MNCLGLTDGKLCLPDELRINFAGRIPPYKCIIFEINVKDFHVVIPVVKVTMVRIGAIPTKAKI